MTTPTPAQQLEPCPFCGGINTEVREKTMWTGMRSQLINVEVHHWCDVKCGASRGHIELAAPTRDEAIAAWNQRTPDDREIVPSGCGVEARIHFEDPRYPTLVLEGDEFGTIGYELRRDTGELRRVCICHAHCEHECVCGYDAATASGGEDRK